MRHAALVRGEIDLAKICARIGRGNNPQMDSRSKLRIEKLLLVQPDKSGGVLHQKMRLATQYGDGVSRKNRSVHHGVGNLRVIRRECQAVLRPAIVCEALGFSIWEHLHVNLVGAEKGVASADERGVG